LSGWNGFSGKGGKRGKGRKGEGRCVWEGPDERSEKEKRGGNLTESEGGVWEHEAWYFGRMKPGILGGRGEKGEKVLGWSEM